jgi:hypothetical protein
MMSLNSYLNVRIVELQVVVQGCDECTRSLTQVHRIQAFSAHNNGGNQNERHGTLIELTPCLQQEKMCRL